MSGAAISTRGTRARDVRMCPRALHGTWQPLLGAGSVTLGAGFGFLGVPSTSSWCLSTPPADPSYTRGCIERFCTLLTEVLWHKAVCARRSALPRGAGFALSQPC